MPDPAESPLHPQSAHPQNAELLRKHLQQSHQRRAGTETVDDVELAEFMRLTEELLQREADERARADLTSARRLARIGALALAVPLVVLLITGWITGWWDAAAATLLLGCLAVAVVLVGAVHLPIARRPRDGVIPGAAVVVTGLFAAVTALPWAAGGLRVVAVVLLVVATLVYVAAVLGARDSLLWTASS